MSMNLYFENFDGKGTHEFPYQTRTNVSFEVLNAPTIEEKINIIKKDLAECKDREWVNKCIKEIEWFLRSKSWKLNVM